MFALGAEGKSGQVLAVASCRDLRKDAAGAFRQSASFSKRSTFAAAVCAISFLLVAFGAKAQMSINCADPQNAQSAVCAQQANLAQGLAMQAATGDASSATSPTVKDVYVDSGGFDKPAGQRQTNGPSTAPAAEPLTDFQRLTEETTGQALPIFGRELFRSAPSTFAPANQVQVPDDYILGPGDQVLVRMWGHDSFNGNLTVDRAGAIYIPEVGSIQVAGDRFDTLQGKINQRMTRTYKNFQLSVSLGQLRSIQVFVLGEATHPGSYTVSSLSTAFNALLESGGSTPQGSLRHIEIRRGGKTVTTLDLYDFILHGDKSKDITLQAGDVIFIPVVGSQVALSGSVKQPAIYELNGETSMEQVLALGGGLTSTAAGNRISVSRVEDHRQLEALSFPLDSAGLSTPVRDGDILTIGSVLPMYNDTVTIRGNVANAGRFPWHPGMRLSDIIPDRASLLTNGYWLRRNRTGLPTPLFTPDNSLQSRQMSAAMSANATQRQAASGQDSSGSGFGTLAQQQEAEKNQRDSEANDSRSMDSDRQGNDIVVPTPQIDWAYAVIERLDPSTLRNSLVPFNLGHLVIDHDPSQDLLLQAGDIVTILSQSDISIAVNEQTKYVKLEGEFASSGTYSAGPNETLRDVVRRAGGLTPQAYLFGAAFTRESARIMQQQRLNEYVNSLSIQIERSASQRLVSSINPSNTNVNSNSERDLIQQLRSMRATGRVVLEFQPDSAGDDAVPAIPLENGDTFSVPSRPILVSVVGAVNGQNVFLYHSGRRVRDYLDLAGRPTRVADQKHEFVIRADGSVASDETLGHIFGDRLASFTVYPGDTIVVPEKPIKPSTLRDVIDWSQVFSQFAIGAAAIEVLK